MDNDQKKWLYLIVLSLVWGSSFILIKKSLLGLSPLQVGALRVVIASLFLVCIGFSRLKKISKSQWKWVTISGLVGTFIPAFFFAFAQTEIDSAVTSILNSTTPLMTLVLGALLFSIGFTRRQLLGVCIGLLGCLWLVWQGADLNPNQNYWFTLFVFTATVCYALNVNIIKTRLQDLSPLAIATGAFLTLLLPAFAILVFSGFFSEMDFANETFLSSMGFVALLAVVGTALALLLFNKLIQISTPVFTTSVTYTIPIVALLWGLLDGERFTLGQGAAAGIILAGVVLANRGGKKRKVLSVKR